MIKKDIVLTINAVEPALVRATHKLSQALGRPLHGLVLVNQEYDATSPNRLRDASGLFKEIVVDFNDQDALQRALKPYMDRILVANCRFEHSIHAFAKVLPFLPYINTPSETALHWSTEKFLMRERLRNYAERLVPKYIYLHAEDLPHLKRLIDGFKFPVIVKPANLAKSLLVSHCQSPQELQNTLERTFRVIDEVYEREHRLDKPHVLVEEMMQGEMYSTDAYVTHNGRIECLPLVRVLTAHDMGLPGFYSYRHIVPVNLPPREVEAAFEAAKASIRALNLSASTAHIELFRTADGWKIIELGARIGGYREPLYREAYGIDHFYNDLAVRLGLPLDLPKAPQKHAAGFNIYADEEGVIEAIEGIEVAKKVPSVVELDVHARPGDIALFAGNGGDLIVDGILSHPDPDQLEKDMAKVRELIKIKVGQYESEPEFSHLY